MSEMLEVPHRLADVADPCTETYHPEWAARGMRAVRCTRPAKATVHVYGSPAGRRVCGIHAKRHDFPRYD